MLAPGRREGGELSRYPIPAEALDDRLAWTGTSGSGKTYNAGAGVERLLAHGARVIIIDPLDVWWGLRLAPDGQRPSRFKPVIFGGPRGDLPLNERSGALLGETCATMRESCIVSLADFRSTAAERRFMLDFLSALYRSASGEPVHLVFDEADLWAPQVILDRDGDAAKLLGQMQTIVRRGRVKGFIPWLITQRPAEISKGVLSQVDGLLAFKLTSSQDRDAIGGWIKGQADAEVGKAILASLPGLQLGQGVVWVPGRGILETATFPAKATFDSSRTPKRGEAVKTAALKALDLGALRERMTAVEEEAKANDPKVLKAEIARLRAEVQKPAENRQDPAKLAEAEARGYERGLAEGRAQSWKQQLEEAGRAWTEGLAKVGRELQERLQQIGVPPKAASFATHSIAPPTVIARPAAQPKPSAAAAPGASSAQQRILDALAWWAAFGIKDPTNEQVAFIAGYSPGSGNFNNLKGGLRSAGWVDYPAPGRLTLTEDGLEKASAPDPAVLTTAAFHARVRAKLSGPQVRLLDPILGAYPQSIASDEVAAAAGYSAGSGNFNNLRGSLRTIGLIDYPAPGQVRAADWLFPEGA